MGMHHRLSNGVLSALTVTLLAACAGEGSETLLASAKEYLAKNDTKAAVIQIKNALQRRPESAEARFLLGKALLQSGDPVGAEIELRKALDARHPADDVVPLLAQALLATGEAKKVLGELQKIELKGPEAKADLLTAVATAEATTGHLDKARAAIDAALAVKADHAPTTIMKARLLLADRDVPGAVALLDTVVGKDAKNAEAWKLKGDILSAQKDAEGGLAAYRKAIEANPDFVMAHAAIVESLVWQGKLDDAGSQLEAMKTAVPKSPQTAMVEAEYLYQKKDFKPALASVQEVLKVAPNHPKALLLAGAVQYQLHSMGQAEEHLSRALKQMPDNQLGRRMLAVVYLRTGQPAKALTTLEPLLEAGAKESALMSLAGDVYMQNGKPQQAQEYFSKAAALDPKNSAKQTKVALSHFAEGKADEAFGELERIASGDTGTTADMAMIAAAIKKRDFAKAMKAIDGLEKKQPDNPLTHALRGTVLIAKGDVAAGRKSLEKALALKPSYFPAAASLAALDLKDRKTEDARKRFESVLAADPKSIQAGLALAELESKTGAGADKVASLITKTIQANPTEPLPRLALVRYYLQAKEPKKAVSVAQDGVAAIQNSAEMLDALGRAQQAIGDTNQALASYAKLAQIQPGSPQPYLRMAETNVAAKNNPEAIKNLQKALELNPDLLAAQKGLIVLHLNDTNFEEAQKVAREVKKQRPKEAAGYAFEGDIAAARKDWAAAATAYKEGLKQTPATELAVKTYAVLYGANKAAEAEKFATGWLSDHPQDAGFRLAMAESATARKDHAASVRHYQTLLQKQPNNPILLNNLGWSLGQLKDPRALEYAEKANKLAPDQPAIMETLGSLLVEKGDAARGIELLEKALERAPESPAVKMSLAKAQTKAGRKDVARKLLDELAKLGDKFKDQAEVARLMKEIGN